jgi:hypothetical protein
MKKLREGEYRRLKVNFIIELRRDKELEKKEKEYSSWVLNRNLFICKT